MFMPKREPAYGMVEAFRKGDDASFSATMQAGKAARAITADEVGAAKRSFWESRGGKSEAVFAFPLIVVSGKLIEAQLAEDGNSVITKEVGQHTLLVRNPDIGPVLSVIHVVAQSDLASFIRGAETTCDGIFSWCSKNSAAIEHRFSRDGILASVSLDQVIKRP